MNTVWIVLPVLILLMFQLGIGLDGEAFLRVARRPKAVFVGLFGQLVALPLLAFGVALAFDLPPYAFMGLLLVACCPGGSSSNVFSLLAGGDVALSVTLTAVSSVVTLFTIPLVMGLAAGFVAIYGEQAVALPAGRLLMQNIVLVFLPMFLGMLFRRVRPTAALRCEKLLGRCAFPALMLFAVLFFLQYRDTIIDHLGLLGTACLVLILAAMGTGTLLARGAGLEPAVRRTIVIEVGMQNAAQAIAIALSPLVFGNSEMAVPAIVYALLMNVVLLIYLSVVRRLAR